jgi:hypothetical protein
LGASSDARRGTGRERKWNRRRRTSRWRSDGTATAAGGSAGWDGLGLALCVLTSLLVSLSRRPSETLVVSGGQRSALSPSYGVGTQGWRERDGLGGGVGERARRDEPAKLCMYAGAHGSRTCRGAIWQELLEKGSCEQWRGCGRSGWTRAHGGYVRGLNELAGRTRAQESGPMRRDVE